MSEDHPPELPKFSFQEPAAAGAPPVGVPPVPPPAGLLHRDETPLMEYMRRRMEMMERELVKERERSLAAENLIKQQDALRGEVENQLRQLTEQSRNQKTLQQLEEERSQSRGRIESLENRLDEMHKTWSALLKDAFAKPQQSLETASADVRVISSGLFELRKDLSELHHKLAPLPTLVPEVADLRAIIPTATRRAEEDDKALRDQLRQIASQLGEQVLDRLNTLDHRIAQDLDRYQERLNDLVRERTSLVETLDQQHNNIRAEFLRERNAQEAQFNSRLEGLRQAVEGIAGRQDASARSFDELKSLTQALHAILTQPVKAKDQLVQELEQEKSDLMRALRERSQQLRNYTIERREVERSLGESLMDLTRQLESQRAAEQEERQKASSLELLVTELRAHADLSRKETELKEQRLQAMAAERDEVVKALAAEAGKSRELLAERAEADRRWEDKLSEQWKLLQAEREARSQSERTAEDLRRQLQALADHIARVVRDKESVEAKFTHWDKEREELLSVLRKKEDMVSMLSSTFQNLLKKPS